MNKVRKRRLYMVMLFAFGLSLATSLILYALKQNISVFLTPSQIDTMAHSNNDRFRLGGMVKTGSVVRNEHGLDVQFVITDFKRDILVHYQGVLPDLFREGKGVVVEGHLYSSPKILFDASVVLAKHDENYMPKNVYKELRESLK